MNRALTDMLHCMNTPENIAGNDSGMTVMERQLARLKWQIQQSGNSHQSYSNETQFNILPITDPMTESHQFQGLINTELAIPIRDLANQSMKADPGFENGWSDLEKSLLPRTGFVGEKTGFLSPDMDYPLSRTASCPQAVVVTGSAPEKMTSTVGRESFKKRKSTKAQNSKVNSGEDRKEKKMKGDVEEVESKVTEENNNNNNNREASCDTSKENSKASEVQKLDYIHVRARRGQATDSHSLAERVRREKISERMKYLQDLVPGCNKITGKAGMLDEIINYVQSLQRQVEFLSMKLATVNPRLDFNIDNFLTKEVFQACTGEFPAIGISPEMVNPAYLQLNPVQQIISCCGLDMNINPSDDMALRRTTSAPVAVPETFLDSSCFPSQPTSSNWENDLQNLYNVDFHQGRSNLFPFQPFTGTMEDNNLKMEM